MTLELGGKDHMETGKNGLPMLQKKVRAELKTGMMTKTVLGTIVTEQI